ncbi:hypothetical protein N7488_010944 [Penicillium malachiteum]|nr:hypothetical protein N7488_010944 [Penicillium malachiteum]
MEADVLRVVDVAVNDLIIPSPTLDNTKKHQNLTRLGEQLDNLGTATSEYNSPNLEVQAI